MLKGQKDEMKCSVVQSMLVFYLPAEGKINFLENPYVSQYFSTENKKAYFHLRHVSARLYVQIHGLKNRI